MDIYIYIRMYMCIYKHIHICIYRYIYIRIYISYLSFMYIFKLLVGVRECSTVVRCTGIGTSLSCNWVETVCLQKIGAILLLL